MRPARMSWACMNSSMSCRPVTSGAPSLMTRSALCPVKCARISSTFAMEVMSPWMVVMPSMGVMGWRSMEMSLGMSSSGTPFSFAGR